MKFQEVMNTIKEGEIWINKYKDRRLTKIQKSYNNIIFEFNNEYRDIGVNLNDIFVLDKKNLAYLINMYNNPMINKFFKSKNVTIKEDDYALSCLIQWIFRSQIRDNKEINLYIPSSRMRYLLKEWLTK